MTAPEATTRQWNGITIPTAGTFKLDPVHSQVGFVIRHLMVSKVKGKFTEVEAEITIADDPTASSVTAVIQASSVDTGVADRDNHIRTGDFLEIEKYPTLTFRSTAVKDASGDTFTLVGDLTIKDVTKEVELEVEFGGVGKSPYGYEAIGFSATTEIDREEFGVNFNAALETGGVMLGKKVKIEIEGEAIRQA
jgi:polyisoprenoid-binding protein YceI